MTMMMMMMMTMMTDDNDDDDNGDMPTHTHTHRFGYPLMLKSRKMAYDGKGNAVAKTESDVPDAFQKLGMYPNMNEYPCFCK